MMREGQGLAASLPLRHTLGVARGTLRVTRGQPLRHPAQCLAPALQCRPHARYLALRFSGNSEFLEKERNVKSSTSARMGGDQIDYEDQDPLVHQVFVKACAQHGSTVNMKAFRVAVAPAPA